MEQQQHETVAEKKVQITVPEELWRRVRAAASLQGLEISAFTAAALENHVSGVISVEGR